LRSLPEGGGAGRGGRRITEELTALADDAVYSTRVSRHVDAPRSAVYRALLDADAIARWRVPADMSSQVHAFDPREGGAFRVSLTYDLPGSAGKSASRTDTYHGRFVKLVPDRQVVEALEFETEDPALRGVMTIGAGEPGRAGGSRLPAVAGWLHGPGGRSVGGRRAGGRG
jgi:uncharacterized protein YndB with AHSA1/START domain